MPSEQQPPGSNGAAVAASPTSGTAPTPSPAELGPDTPESATEPTPKESGAGGALPPETPEPGTAEATRTPEPRERVAVAAVAATVRPDSTTRTGVDRGRPRKPVLAGAALAGAALVAIPVLLIGANDDGPRDDKRSTSSESDTVLSADPSPDDLGDYVEQKPEPSPTKEKQPPKKVVAPASPPPAPTTSAPAPKETPKPKPKPKATPEPDWGVTTIRAPSVLEVDQAWTTNRIRMIMQPDGNLVVYNEKNKPIWASMTFGEHHKAIFQSDGNLVIHNGDDRPIWASKSHGHEGARLVLRADAKVVVVHNGRVVWST